MVAFLLLTGIGWPRYVEAAQIPLHREVLPNGLVLQVVPRPELPILTVSLGIRAGARYDPAGRAGTANLVAALLTEGTANRNAEAIAEAIEFVGGSLQVSAGADYTTATVGVLSRDRELGMSLLADVVVHPRFPAAEVARVRTEVLSGIRAARERPGSVAAKVFAREVFADHPYAHSVDGEDASVPTIDRETLQSFHRTWYRPERAVLNMVGAVTVVQARALAMATFGPWRGVGESPPEPSLPIAPPPASTRLVTVDRPVSQANVILGYPAISRADADFYPVLVMNYILGGGGFESRLVDRVRDQLGLAYSVYSGFHGRLDPGPFMVRFQTRNAAAQQAIDAVIAEMRGMRAAPVTATELTEAQAYLTGSFPLRMDTNAKLANLLTFVEMNGLGDGYFSRYLEQVQAVTSADVLRVAKKWLRPDRMVWVVVANLKEARVAVP